MIYHSWSQSEVSSLFYVLFGLQALWLNDFSKIYQLKSLKPKNKGHTNFYECCDLTKKVSKEVCNNMCATQLLTILLLLTPLLSSIKEHKRQTRQQATILPNSHIRCDNNNFMTPDLLVSSISFALQKSFYLELVDDIGCIKHFFHIMKIRESKAFIHWYWKYLPMLY